MTSPCLRGVLVIVAVVWLGFATGEARAQATAHLKVRSLFLRVGTQDGPEGLNSCNKFFDFIDPSGLREGSEPIPDIACSAGSASSHVSVVTSAPNGSNVSELTTTADASVQRTDEPFEVANAVFFEQAMFTAAPGTSFEDDGGLFSVVHCTSGGVATSRPVADGVFSATGTICLESGLRSLPDSFLPGFPTSQHRVQTGTIRFGTPRGACCNSQFDPDPREEDILCEERPPARCRSHFVYQGDGTTCGGTCALGDDITWTDPAGGSFDDAANWQPPVVPTSDADHDATAIFDLANTYAVNVAGARAKRMVIRNSSIDLVGGTAEVTSSSLAEPSLVVGQNGKLHLVSGTFTSVHSVLGDVSGGLAEVDLISGTPIWNNTGRLTIGDAGPGRLTVVAGEVTSAESRIGGGLLGAGEATIGGPGTWTTGDLGLGLGGGPGTLEIRDGGDVTSNGAVIGVAFGTGNAATVRGAAPADDSDASSWTLSGELVVGAAGAGSLSVEESALVECASLVVGNDAQGVGTATVTGAKSGFKSTLRVINTLGVGIAGVGELFVKDHGAAEAAEAQIGSSALGTLAVTDDGSGLAVTNTIWVGGSTDFDARPNANGTLRIEDGALVTADRMAIGNNPGSIGHVVIRGEAAGDNPSRLTLTTLLRVGSDGAADLTIENGARLDLGDAAEIAVSAPIAGSPAKVGSTVTIRGVGTLGAPSRFKTKGSMEVGGGGRVAVEDGSVVNLGALGLGRGGAGEWGVGGGSHASFTVVDGLFLIGVFDGEGVLTVTKGGRVFASNGLTIGGLSPGTVSLDGHSAGQTGTTPPRLEVTGALEVGFGAPGSILLDGGVLVASGTTTIHSVGAIVGNGQVTGAIVNDGGCFAISPTPGASAGCAAPTARAATRKPGATITAKAEAPRTVAPPRSTTEPTLLLDGDLVVKPGAIIRIELDGTGPALRVTGSATLTGTLEVAFVNGFVPRAGDELQLFDVLGLTAGTFTSTVVTGFPPGWKSELAPTGTGLALTVFGDYLCYQTKLAGGAKFPKDLQGGFDTTSGPLAFGVKKPALLCNPSGPSTGSQQADDTQLRGYVVTDPSADPLAIAARTLRVTNGLHPTGDLVVDTSATTLVLAPAAKCADLPSGTCPTDLAAPLAGDAFVCALAKRSKSGAAFPKTLTASAVDGFGEPRTYKLAKPTRVCAPTTGALDHALACYAAKPLGKVCALAAPTNATGACKSELDCGGTKKLTHFCAKQSKHTKVEGLVLATSLARDRAATVKPLELCVPSVLVAP